MCVDSNSELLQLSKFFVIDCTSVHMRILMANYLKWLERDLE